MRALIKRIDWLVRLSNNGSHSFLAQILAVKKGEIIANFNVGKIRERPRCLNGITTEIVGGAFGVLLPHAIHDFGIVYPHFLYSDLSSRHGSAKRVFYADSNRPGPCESTWNRTGVQATEKQRGALQTSVVIHNLVLIWLQVRKNVTTATEAADTGADAPPCWPIRNCNNVAVTTIGAQYRCECSETSMSKMKCYNGI